MKGNVCMGLVLKCSRSRMSHLILPERKESESNEKRGMAAAAKSGGAVAAKKAGDERWRLVIAESKSNRMMESRGMEEHKHYSRGN